MPPLTDSLPNSEGGGGSSDGTGGKAPATGGTSNTAGGFVTSGGVAVVMPSGGEGGMDALGGADGAGGAGGAGGASDSMPIGGAGGGAEVPDNCPNDPDKSAPGVCGCGLPEQATATFASCTALTSKLVHRYDFEGSGTAVTDRVGVSHGVVMGGATLSKLAGRGVVQLGGGTNGAYVDLPNGLVSSLPNATFEAWITWGGGTNYQRVFDFGDSDSATPENNPANGKTYLFVSPKGGAGGVTLGYSLAGNLNEQEQNLVGAAALSQSLSQVVAVADATGDTLTLYVNGAQVGTQAWTGALSGINDVNAWLGRSQYSGDAELTGTYHEFRVYGAALGATEIATAFKAGTDPEFMPK